MKKLPLLLAAGLCIGMSATALAKLPPLSDEAKAKAAATAAKTAWTGKQDTYSLCKSQDKVAVAYYATSQSAGRQTKPPAATAPCAEPGPFAYVPADAKPIEAAGAHSPATTAASPPSTKQPDAVANPAKK